MDFAPYSDYAIYALLALAVLFVLMLLIRMIGSKVRGRQGNRLGISEFHEIDKSRRLVLVRRDDIEHLVMIGGSQDIVIEHNIGLDEITVPQHLPPPQPDFLSDSQHHQSAGVAPQSATVTPMAPRAPKPVSLDRAPNLRPVEREEPRLGAANPDNDQNT